MTINYTLEDIAHAAAKVVESIGNNKIIALHGEMGAGKTTLSQEICRQLGVTQNMSSPTFSIINSYEDATGDIVYHLDLYRLKDEEEVINAGVEDTLYSGKICLVEWPEVATKILPEETTHLYIEATSLNERKIKIL